MSQLTETAEREALEAETEAPEEEEAAAEEEAQPEPTPAPDPNDLVKEAAFKKADAENNRHAKNIMKVFDGIAPVYPCMACEGNGYLNAPAPAGPEYAHAPDTETCQACNGLGEVLTGAHNPHNERRACQTCGGSGYVMVATPLAPVASIGAPAEPYPGYGVAFVPVPGGIEDGWHRPAGHPQWGLDPAQIAPTGTP